MVMAFDISFSPPFAVIDAAGMVYVPAFSAESVYVNVTLLEDVCLPLIIETLRDVDLYGPANISKPRAELQARFSTFGLRRCAW